ncbi:MAG: UDP-N-acetylmuramoyl-tripeptide--D-alanyl-D-alanine ligase [Christensenellales bacterium]|jgi:UDP-N-acetylmuramoyl-tripeptide--D-alanyl-D-alanine ligase
MSLLIGALFGAALTPLAALEFVHMFQLEGYVQRNYYQWIKAHLPACALPLALAAVAALLWLLPVAPWANQLSSGSVLTALVALYALYVRQKPAKKPLVFTARVKRLLAGIAAVGLVLGLVTPCLPVGVVCLAVSLAAVLLAPVERAVKRGYFNRSKATLAGYTDMIKIGITGSYGKTSAKFMLGAILSEAFDTLVTPHSYNTPMGVCRVIGETMKGTEQVFVAEMGARHRGDIAEMCLLVGPRYGLITSVGPQHLETFGDLETVAKTKYELIEALPEDGVAFFPDDGGICRQLYERTDKPKRLFGIEGEGYFLCARDLTVGPWGSRFTLEHGAERVEATCCLLGRHNVMNLLGAASVALELGMDLAAIARGIGKIAPIEHRLQLLPSGNGVTVIDDAFNANPAGFAAAMEVLRGFPGRKIVLTPGLVELGEAEQAENRKAGQRLGESCDIAILVGRKRSAPLVEGLKDVNFAGQLIVAENFAEATAALGKLTRVGDVVLFENDLPDNLEG